MVMKQDGSVWATGSNANGQLGDGTKTKSVSFKSVIKSGVKAVFAGADQSFVLKEDNSVKPGRQQRY